MTINDVFFTNAKGVLDGYIKDAEKSSGKKATTAIVVALAGLAFFCISYFTLFSKLCVYGCDTLVYALTVVAILIEVAAIICFIHSGKAAGKAADYRKEIILLRDIQCSVALLEGLSNDPVSIEKVDGYKTTTEKKPSERSKMQQQIINTLLNHYSG